VWCLQNERQPIPDVPAVYFVRGGEAAVDAVAADAAKGLYDTMHLNFAPGLPPPLLERLAGKLVSAGAAHRVAKV
jgi:sec1 family domain-containing protein 1